MFCGWNCCKSRVLTVLVIPALHLAINEQRRQNRLKQRMTAIHKDVDVLKERAQRLLQFCRQEPDAHDLEPEFPEPASQPKAPRKYLTFHSNKLNKFYPNYPNIKLPR